MPKRSDARTLKNLVDQAYLIASSDPVPPGGIESLRENLAAAKKLTRLLLTDTPSAAASQLGALGGKKTAARGPEYFKQIAAMRKTNAGGRPSTYQDVLINGQSPSQVRSRSAFIMAKRVKELNLTPDILASIIGCSQQYAKDLLRGTKIPSDETIQAVINGLDLDNFQAEQIRMFAVEDRRRHDARYRREN